MDRHGGRAGVFVLLFSTLALTQPLSAQWVEKSRGVNRVPVPDRVDIERYRSVVRGDSARGFPLRILPPLRFVSESESNDSLVTADTVKVGDAVTGVIDPAGDVDYFALTISAGTILDISVDAARSGSPLDSRIALFDSTASDADLLALAINDDALGTDSRILYFIAVTGQYRIGITGNGAGPTASYSLNIGQVPPGESEPNDGFSLADSTLAGDTIFGVINVADDRDFFFLNVTAGTLLDFDLDAAALGSPTDAFLALFGPLVELLGSNTSADGIDPRLIHYFSETGRHFIEVGTTDGLSGPEFLYSLRINQLPTGPGDPVTSLAEDFGTPVSLVFDASGNGYALDQSLGRVIKFDPLLNTSEFPAGRDVVVSMAVDGFGDLLVTGFDFGGDVVIQRLTPTGSPTVFSNAIGSAGPIAVDADGDVWVITPADGQLIRFDPFGSVQSQWDVSGVGPFVFDMAFAPGGELFISDGISTVFTFDAGVLTPVIVETPNLDGIAFDAAGNLYVANGFVGRINLYDAAQQSLQTPFARSNLGGAILPAFQIDAAGASTTNLFVAQGGFRLSSPFVGSLAALNASGVATAGFVPGTRFLAIEPIRSNLSLGTTYEDTLRLSDAGAGSPTWSVYDGTLPDGLVLDSATGVISGDPTTLGFANATVQVRAGNRRGFLEISFFVEAPSLMVQDVVDGFLGVPGILSENDERFLDLIGNQNGLLDVGDIQAYLRFIETNPPSVRGNGR